MAYTESQKKSIYRYRMKNLDKINEKQKEYSKTYYQKHRDEILQRRASKKILKTSESSDENSDD